MNARTNESGQTLSTNSIVTVWYTDPSMEPRSARVARCDGIGITLIYPSGIPKIFHPWHTIDQVADGNVLGVKDPAPVIDPDLDPDGEDDTEVATPNDAFGFALADAMSRKPAPAPSFMFNPSHPPQGTTHFFTNRETRAIEYGVLVASSPRGFEWISQDGLKSHVSWSKATVAGVMKAGV